MSAYAPDGTPIANTWQGVFPVYNSGEDRYVGTAPVGCFPANGYGIFDMIGNVWDWTSDWYRAGHSKEPAVNPMGPDLVQVGLIAGQAPSKVIKGGSYLCAHNYCARYRPTSRQPQEVDLSAGHVGFRTVLNVSRAAAHLWRPERGARSPTTAAMRFARGSQALAPTPTFMSALPGSRERFPTSEREVRL
jgi:hypothetical protein